MFLLFIHLKILLTFIFDKSRFNDKWLGIDLNKFSISPPPVICAAALIRFFLVNFKISLE